MDVLNELIIPLQVKLADLNLDLSTILQGTPLLLALWYLTSVFRQWWRLRHIPGPFLNSITPLVYTYHSLRGDGNTYTYNQTRKYGPLVRISPNVVVFSDPDTFRRVCSPKSHYTKGLWFEFLRWDLQHHSCVTMRDDASRKERKAKLMPAWQSGSLAKMEKRFDAVLCSFIDLVERKYISTPGNLRPMDFGERAIMFTLDVATSVTYGETWGCIQKDSDVNKYIESSEGSLGMFGVLSSMPWLVYVTRSWPFNLMMPGEGDSVGFGSLMKFSSDQVRLRVKSSIDPERSASEHDLIGSYLKNGVEPEDVAQECNSLIVAGTETTAVALK